MSDPPFPHLRDAPLVEAAIEIRAEIPVPLAEHCFDSLRDWLAGDYPHASAVRSTSARIDLEPEQLTTTKTPVTQFGLRLESADRKTIVVAKKDGLLVSRLRPYADWDALLAVVRLIWPKYIELFAPVSIVRLGVRYINRIEYLAGDDLDAIFTAGPKVPPELPQQISQYRTSVLVPLESCGAFLTISQALDPSTAPGKSGALLDIDAFSPVHLLPDAPEIWEQFDKLRYAKNKAFFSALHRSVWEKYQ